MRQCGWLGMALAAGVALAGCGGGGERMDSEQRQALTDEMLESDSLSSGYIGGGQDSIGSP